jgi:hypothetical protein
MEMNLPVPKDFILRFNNPNDSTIESPDAAEVLAEYLGWKRVQVPGTHSIVWVSSTGRARMGVPDFVYDFGDIIHEISSRGLDWECGHVDGQYQATVLFKRVGFQFVSLGTTLPRALCAALLQWINLETTWSGPKDDDV